MICTDVFFVRHGEPVLKKTLLGFTDSPLNQLGWAQMETNIKPISGIDLVISSPLIRCADFAQRYAKKNKVALEIDARWKECFFGDWDGETYDFLYENYPDELNNFFNQPAKFMPPKGEPLWDFCHRVERVMEKMLLTHMGKNILVFTHAGVIRTLIAWCLNIDYESGIQFKRFALDYGSITHIRFYHDKKIIPQIMLMNYRREVPEIPTSHERHYECVGLP
ncbi:histidine phosphatase family protein [Aliikangiella maris]|uniref:Histidine phosphatase family protein n=2 Tax=Aliikangiella maris TaxID=3162458 RepID=A0ABV2BWN8_9GAMM